MTENKHWFLKGIKAGIPIAMGYFAVSIALGIAAVKAGMTPFEASLTSFLINASAGEFVGFTLIGQGAGYLEVIIMEAVANARYLLMSCALSQKLDSKTSLLKRMILGFNVTDEIFGVSISAPGRLNPFYAYGMDVVAMPGWALGTLVGAILGAVLPARIVSALSVALYGMFVAIFIPPAKENRVVLGLVIISFAASFLAEIATKYLEFFSKIPDGVQIIALTVIISLVAAIVFPRKEEKNDEE